MPVALLNLAVPLFLSLALVRAIVSFAALCLSACHLAARFRALHQLDYPGLPGALPDGAFRRLRSRRSNPSVSRSAQKLDLWLILHGVVTDSVHCSSRAVVRGLAGASPDALEGTDSNVRAVITRAGKSVLIIVALLSQPGAGRHRHHRAVRCSAAPMAGRSRLRHEDDRVELRRRLLILLDQLDPHRQHHRHRRHDQRRGDADHDPPHRRSHARRHRGDRAQRYLRQHRRATRPIPILRCVVPLPLTVAYGADLELAMRLMVRAAASQARVLTNPDAVGDRRCASARRHRSRAGFLDP